MKKIFLGITAVILLAFASNLHAAPSEYYINATSTPGCINVTTAGLLWSSGLNCGGGGSSSIGPINTLQASDGSGGFIATGTPTLTVGSLFATSTTATSTFAGGVTGPNNFTIQSSSGKIGFGTSSPYGLITIERAGSSGVPVFYLAGPADSTGTRDCIRLTNNMAAAGEQPGLRVFCSGDIIQYNNVGTLVNRLNPNSNSYITAGNFGVGTTSPYARLAVVGQAVAEYFTATSTTATSSLHAISTEHVHSQTSAGTTYYSHNGTQVALYGAGGGSNATFYGGVNVAGQVSTDNGVTIVGADGIGVSINDPSGTYGIYGTTGDYDYVLADQDSGIGFYLKEISSGRQINLLNTGSQLATFVGSGNFGIGTSSPYSKLSVVGQVVGANFIGTTTAYNQFINQRNTRVDAIDSTGITTYSFDGDPVLRTGNLGGDTVEVIAGLTVGSNATITGLAGVANGAVYAPSSGTLTTESGYTYNQTTNLLTAANMAVTDTDSDSFRVGNSTAGYINLGTSNIRAGSFTGGLDLNIANNGGVRFVSASDTMFQAFGRDYASFGGQFYFDYGAAASVGLTNGAAIWRNNSRGTETVMHLNVRSLVGIGTSAQTAVLHVASTTSGNNDLFKVVGGAAGNQRGTMVFTGTGNTTCANCLGIGTTTPYSKLSVVGQVVAANFNATSTSATSTFSGGVVFQKPPKLPSYTVATLPTCNAGAQGSIAYVTDALAPAFLVAIAGGGAIIAPVFCDGTNWIAH